MMRLVFLFVSSIVFEGAAKSLCSSKSIKDGTFNFDSCPASWTNGRRCAVVKGLCRPNCLHPENQKAHLCEAPFCHWSEHDSVCGFSVSYDSNRREFCKDHVAPDIAQENDEEMTTSKRELAEYQDMFCFFAEDAAGYGHVQLTERDRVSAILAQASRCWKPSLANRSAHTDSAAQAAFAGAVAQSLFARQSNGGPNLHPVTTFNDYSIRFASGPSHGSGSAVTSRCLDFDYDGDSQADEDPAGCSLFKASFQPLQKLVQCMEPKIRDDPYFKVWQAVHQHGAFREPEDDWHAGAEAGYLAVQIKDVLQGTDLLQPHWAEPRQLAELMRQWRDCVAKDGCSAIGSMARTMELLVKLDRESWGGLDVSAIGERFVAAAGLTRSAVLQSNRPSLRNETVFDMMESCFGLQPSQTPMTSGDGLMLKEALPCLPLMWDQVELRNFHGRSVLEPESARRPSDEHAWKRWEPLCGRVALAGLAEKFAHARPALLDAHHRQLNGADDLSTDYCFNPNYVNGKSLVQCWVAMMEDYVAEEFPLCKKRL